MMNSISWGSYWYFLSFSLVLYYGYVLLVYYRPEIAQRLHPKSFVATSTPNMDSDQSHDDPLFPSVQSLSNEISAFLEQASYAKPVKEELIYGLQQIAKKYQGIYQSSHRHSIEQLIKFEFRDKCALSISPEEATQVWLV